MLGTKEFYDLMDQFEKISKTMVQVPSAFAKEPKELWRKKIYYQNGHTNNAFIIFMNGYSLGKAVARE